MEGLVFVDDPAPHWDCMRDSVVFFARLDDRPLSCSVSFELLNERCGLAMKDHANEREILRAFTEHRKLIQEAATAKIEADEIDDGNKVFLSTNEFRIGENSVSNAVRSEPTMLSRVLRATWILEATLGGRASQTRASWSEVPGEPAAAVVTLTLADCRTGVSAKKRLTVEQLGAESDLGYVLNKLWGQLLAALTRRLLKEMTAASAGE